MEGAPKHVADLVDLIKRTGAYGMQMREVVEPPPACWVVFVEHFIDPDGYPTFDTENRNVENHYTFSVGETIGEALMRMVKLLYEGGNCMHCMQPSSFYAQLDGNPPFADFMCQVFWHPEQLRYARTCLTKQEA